MWESSYEAELHIQLFGKSAGPVCHTLTGYASGWATAFLGPRCWRSNRLAWRVAMRAVHSFCARQMRLVPEADSWKKNLHFQHASLFEVSRQLAEQIATVQRQDALIRRLSTPVLEVWKDVLAVPIVGAIDEIRSHVLLESVLTAVSQRAARCVILDITGVDVVDAESASYLVKVARAAQLLGTYCVLTGISSAVATKLVETGADLSGVKTLRSLNDGIQACLRILENGVKARR